MSIRLCSIALLCSLSISIALRLMETQQQQIRPGWLSDIAASPGVTRLDVKEWDDEEWRKDTGESGFKGVDFIHSAQSAVQIMEYLLVDTKHPSCSYQLEARGKLPPPLEGSSILVGSVYFSPRSESHRGFCHGGSFCAVADDLIGWAGFCISGKCKPWSGFTAQINTSLKKPVAVGSVMKVEAWISKKDSDRKYWVTARMKDEANGGDVHFEAEGLFLLSKDALEDMEAF